MLPLINRAPARTGDSCGALGTVAPAFLAGPAWQTSVLEKQTADDGVAGD